MKRMFHPTLDSYVDVDDKTAEAYAAQGWKKTQPKHVTVPDDAPKVGEHPGIVSVTVDSASGATSSDATGTAPTA